MSVTVFSQTPSLGGSDGLGRVLPQNEQTGDLKDNRQVALFYFLWQGDPSSKTSERYWDLDILYREHPEVFEDADHPAWGGGTGKYYFWGKPIYGYYRGDDYWVHLKNIQLLTDAGVDLLVIDATNRITYFNQAKTLMQAMQAIRGQGYNPPKIAFYTNTVSGDAMQEIYDSFYKEDAAFRMQDCWFYLDGKPLIIGISKEAENRNYKDFFTIRESQWPTVPQQANGWPWIEFKRPQPVYFNQEGEKGIINVSVAQHPNPGAGMGGSAFYGNKDNWGRSYRKGHPAIDPEKDILYGFNFQEQWDVVHQQQPLLVFVTGWNEWIAGKWPSHDNNPEHSWFCDQASPEYSRDIEPTLTAGLQDHYYMQFVQNIRRYKGVALLPLLSEKKTIRQFGDWTDVLPEYTDYTGDVLRRDHPGAESEPLVNYTNETGRNDFKMMKVARDNKNVYFYAQTDRPITPCTGENWMTLFIDIDRSLQTGWNGYDFRVTSGNSLQYFAEGEWVILATIDFQLEGNELMITVPNKLLGIADSDLLNFEFKWSDNRQSDDPMDWYINGDAAPGGRFNFVVRSST
ncbi:hypothetical protein [Parabacteroides sp. Marseille-P3160]|uniref:hypothetical protein n=1 Tax=Parabacteroides sp. Marseille-P3160 TaxID=1917887 RepID=UPI0009BB6D0B|nr:hypothetical protein [Parabacteroides sp. Marseille-P3160]